MADVASVVVRIITEKKGDAGKELEGTAAKIDGVSGKFKKFALPAAAAAGAILAFGKSASDSASRTQQAMGAIDSVFGDNAKQVKNWADNAAQSVGLAKSEYGELATVIGSQLKNMGLPLDQVAGKTNDLISLGADLAATYGGTTADAVSALSATLRGETDPIERYGVSINQAAIAAKQAQDGTAGLEGAAGKQAKTMATLSLITQQTADAQGKFNEESDTAAGQSQRAAAEYENMKSSLGTALLPAITAVSHALGIMAKFAGEHPKLFQALAVVFLIVAAALIAIAAAASIYNAVTVITAAVNFAAWGWVALIILGIVAAIAAVIVAIVLLWKKSSTFRAFVLGMWNAIKTAALAVARAVTTAWSATWNALRAAASATAAFFRAVWSGISGAARAVANAVRNAWSGAMNGVRSVTNAVVGAVKGAISGIKSVISGVTNAVQSLVGWIKRIVFPNLGNPFATIKSGIDAVIGAVKSLIGWLGKIKVPKISLPKIPGLGRSAAPSAATATAATTARVAAPLTALGALGTASGGGIVINISGAIDPESTARQIRRVLTGSDIRHSRPGGRGLRTA